MIVIPTVCTQTIYLLFLTDTFADDTEWLTIGSVSRVAQDAAKAKDFMCSSPIRAKKSRTHSNWPHKVNCLRNVAAARRNRHQASKVHENRVVRHDHRPIHAYCTTTMSAAHSIMACTIAAIIRACAHQRIEYRIGRRKSHAIWTAITATVTRHPCRKTMTVSMFRTISRGKCDLMPTTPFSRLTHSIFYFQIGRHE